MLDLTTTESVDDTRSFRLTKPSEAQEAKISLSGPAPGLVKHYKAALKAIEECFKDHSADLKYESFELDILSDPDLDIFAWAAKKCARNVADIYEFFYQSHSIPFIRLAHQNLDLFLISRVTDFGYYTEDEFPWVPIANLGPLVFVGHFIPMVNDFGPLPKDICIPVLISPADYFAYRNQALAHAVDSKDITAVIRGDRDFVPFEDYIRENSIDMGNPEIKIKESLRWLCLHGIAHPSEIADVISLIDQPILELALLPAGYKTALGYLDKINLPLLPASHLEVDASLFECLRQYLQTDACVLPVLKTSSSIFLSHIKWESAAERQSTEDHIQVLMSQGIPGFHLHFIYADPAHSNATRERADSSLVNLQTRGVMVDEKHAPADLEINPNDMLNYKPEIEGEDYNIKRILSWVIFESVKRSASDIRLEEYKGNIRFRATIDRIGQTILMLPSLSLMANFSGWIRNTLCNTPLDYKGPVDGMFSVSIGSRRVDIRVSIILNRETYETFTLRILDKTTGIRTLNNLSLPNEDVKLIQKVSLLPDGICIISGPTGHGKSTTQYAIINGLNQESRFIFTAEDPPEMEIQGVTQVKIKGDMTFGEALRRFLRHAPTIIVVGEIRDFETADLAIRAANTGHLVWATLHANSSLSSVTRLINLGVDAPLLAEYLRFVSGQRLLRSLCQCKRPQRITDEIRYRIFQSHNVEIPKNITHIYSPKGCPACRNTGYRGVHLIMEHLPFNPVIRKIIATAKRQDSVSDSLLTAARANKYASFYAKGLLRVLEGKTSLEEVHRVCTTDSEIY